MPKTQEPEAKTTIRTRKENTSTSPSAERTHYFEDLQGKLVRSGTFDELLGVAREHEAAMKNYIAARDDLCAESYVTDTESLALYPEDSPPLLPIKIYGDGNCLPRSGSVLAFGTEQNHTELRARMTCELALNAEVYLKDSFLSTGHRVNDCKKLYAQYSEAYVLRSLQKVPYKGYTSVKSWTSGSLGKRRGHGTFMP